MAIKGDKKLLGAYLLDILKKETDHNYAKTLEDIIEEISEKYDVHVDKRTIQRYIKMLKNCGYNIISEEYEKNNYHQKAYYINDEIVETFSDAEVRFIIDAIIFSKHINKKMAKHIINQFRVLYSNPLVESLKYINELKPDDEKKYINSNDMFLNIEILHDAIRRKQKIKISLMDCDDFERELKREKKKEEKQEDGNQKVKNEKVLKVYELYPFYMIPTNDIYFLIAYNENAKKGSEIYAIRIDHIKKIELIGSFTPTIKKKYNEFDINTFISEHPLMSYGDAIDCEFKYPSKRIIDVYDFFGIDVNVSGVKTKEYTSVKVKCTGWALKQWIGGHLEFIKDVKVKDLSFAKEMNAIIRNCTIVKCV